MRPPPVVTFLDPKYTGNLPIGHAMTAAAAHIFASLFHKNGCHDFGDTNFWGAPKVGAITKSTRNHWKRNGLKLSPFSGAMRSGT